MEFLMTYGWAILIMVTIVGVLFMLGVFNPTRAVPNACSLPPGFACYAYKVSSGGALYLDLGQSTGGDVTITKFACSAQSPPSMTNTGSQVISSGKHKNLTGLPSCVKSDGSTPASGDYYSGKLVIEYVETRTGITHQISGDISYQTE